EEGRRSDGVPKRRDLEAALSEVAWVLDHEADLDADFLRFFPQLGIHPTEVLDGPRFFALARRVAAYGGVMAVRLQEHLKQSGPSVGGRSGHAARKQVSLTELVAQHPDLISRTKAR